MRGHLSWQLAALLIAVAAIAHEYALGALEAGDPMYLAFYRVALVTIAGSALALVLLPSRRRTYWLAFLACAGLIGYALYLQYGLGLEPCPLCFFQRLVVICMGIVFLAAAVQNPGRAGAWVYAVFATLFGLAGVALAGRHIWIQNLPPAQVPACGMGIEYMLDTLPFFDVVKRTLAGSGECAVKDWEFIGLSIPGWTFVFFVALSVSALAAASRQRRP
jgi:disulfide bond formation protein DsbB